MNLSKKETEQLRKLFNEEIIKYSDDIFEQLLEYENSNCYVRLTEEILDFLDDNLDFQEYKEEYSKNIGEIVFMSCYGEPVYPLTELQNFLDRDGQEKVSNQFQFYTLGQIEILTINDVAENRGFIGIIDSFSHIEYDNFNDLFIYSMLKYLNNK